MKPFFSAMSLPMEKVGSATYKNWSNMSGRVNYNKQYGEINGKCLDLVMTRQRVAMTLLVIDNNLSTDSDGTRTWKDPDRERKYTPAKARTGSGGWSQEGLDKYHALLERETRERREIAQQYKDNTVERPDYFSYPPRPVKKRGEKRKRDVGPPNEEEVFVGVEDTDMNVLGLDETEEVAVEPV